MPESATLIVPRIWIGDRHASADQRFIEENNIGVVFNCTKDLPFYNYALRQYRLPVDDNLKDREIRNMEKWAPEAVYKVVAEYNRGENILIHCYAGMQRSAALTAMAIMVLFNESADDTIDFIRSKRDITFFPGENFGQAIRGFEKTYYDYNR